MYLNETPKKLKYYDLSKNLVCDDSEVEFYRELQSVVDQTPKQDILVVQGDWNAKVGEDAQEDRTRTFPGADVGSDHDMVMMTFQTSLKNSRKPTQPRIRFDLEKLNDATVMSAFQASIGGRFAPLAR